MLTLPRPWESPRGRLIEHYGSEAAVAAHYFGGSMVKKTGEVLFTTRPAL